MCFVFRFFCCFILLFLLIFELKLVSFLSFGQGIPFKSVKKKKGMTVGFVSFESMEQLQTAMEVSLLH